MIITIEKYSRPACSEPGCCHESVADIEIDGKHIEIIWPTDELIVKSILNHFGIESEVKISEW